MRKVIITDLTRFSTPEKVCTAAIDVITGECFRPMPYLKSDRCAELNIHPGAILEGNIFLKSNNEKPHIEDATYEQLKYLGVCSTEDFKKILDGSLSNSVSSGFGINFEVGQKHVPINENASCSIITIKIESTQIKIHEDQFKPGKIKCSFTDGSGHEYRYLSITDRGFFDYAQRHQNSGRLFELQDFLQSQEEIYLRIGLGRAYQVSERNGYWLQVNGIYTFPEFLKEIRSYT